MDWPSRVRVRTGDGAGDLVENGPWPGGGLELQATYDEAVRGAGHLDGHRYVQESGTWSSMPERAAVYLPGAWLRVDGGRRRVVRTPTAARYGEVDQE